jgi:hypothetical protein
LLGRHGVDALVLVLALGAVVEAWFDSDDESRLVTIPFALAWTLPLLLRRRFPLLAPVAVFVVLAAEALSRSTRWRNRSRTRSRSSPRSA